MFTDHCPNCAESFTSPCDFLEHILKVSCEAVGDTPFVSHCSKCGECFVTHFEHEMHKKYRHCVYRPMSKIWRYVNIFKAL